MVDLTHHWERLAHDLSALSRLGGSELEHAMERLLPAAEAPFRLRLVEALSQASEELNSLMPALQVKARVSGSHVAFELEAQSDAAEVSGDLDARISLRLPEDLKFRIETAAARDGLSLNAWLVKTLARSTTQALSGPSGPTAPIPPIPPAGPGRQLRGRGRA